MADWHYLKSGKQKGPVPKEFIQELARSGQLQRTDLVWTEGMKDWLPAENVSELGMSRLTPPPGSAIPGSGAPAQAVSNYLVWSILATIFCCLPSGIVAIIYSSKVNSALALGNYGAALEASKKAKIWNLVSLVVGLVCTALSVLSSIPLIPKIMEAMKAVQAGH